MNDVRRRGFTSLSAAQRLHIPIPMKQSKTKQSTFAVGPTAVIDDALKSARGGEVEIPPKKQPNPGLHGDPVF